MAQPPTEADGKDEEGAEKAKVEGMKILVGRKRIFSEIIEEREDTVTPVLEERMEVNCCQLKCKLNIENYDEFKTSIEKEFGELSKAEGKKKLLQHIKSQENLGFLTDKVSWKGRYLCSRSFSELSKISRYLIQSVLSAHSTGVKELKHGNSGLLKFSEKVDKFKVWVRSFLSKNSQSAPDSVVQVVNSWVTVDMMYKWYQKETVQPHLALKTFYAY